jgi:hypothetical protein
VHRVAAVGIQRLAVEVVLDQVLDLDALGCERARQVIAVRVFRRAQADVAVGVDDAVVRENAVRGDEVVKFFQGVLLSLP